MAIFLVDKKRDKAMVKDSKRLSDVYMGQPVLAQILKYIGKEDVNAIAIKHRSDRYIKKFTTRDHLSSLLYGVMSFCHSLRELVIILSSEQSKLVHLSIDYRVSRSTFARANSNRNPKVFEDIYHFILNRSRRFLRDSRLCKSDVGRLYALDSTTITLFSDILKGTGKPSHADGRQKGGIKAHMLIDVEEGVPGMVKFSKAAKGDAKFMGMAARLPKDSFIAIDKAYSDHGMLEKLTKLRIWYVSRLKDNVKCKALGVLPVPGRQSELEAERGRVISDKVISVSLPRKREGHICRRIEYIGIVKNRNGVEHEKLFVFSINNMRLPAQTIAGIYRKRWQIELMFKSIKQNFPLEYFYGDSVNAIKNQIWAALIACILLTIVHREALKKQKWAFSNVVSLVRRLLMSYIDIHLILSCPNMFASHKQERPPPEQNLFSIAGIEA
ncbi:transposase [Fibrobacteria bacterium R8-3-H12]